MIEKAFFRIFPECKVKLKCKRDVKLLIIINTILVIQ